jgi:monosaccharide-transporting ATPase
MGENGAGKSTLIKVMTGLYEKDAGQIAIDGEADPLPVTPGGADFGIGTVYQEISLCPNLTVAENTFIGRGTYRFVNWKDV